jgi:hypothetical protein
MKPHAAIGGVFALALLGGCSTAPLRPAAESSAIEYPPLLPPASLGVAHTSQQILRAAFGEREVTLRCVLITNPDHFKMIVLTATGQRALTLDWNGTDWNVDKAPMVPAELNPQQLVADVEFALWPLQTLKDAYRPAGWDISEPGGDLRRVRHDGRLFSEVHYANPDPWNGRFWLVNFRYGYSLEIEAQAVTG